MMSLIPLKENHRKGASLLLLLLFMVAGIFPDHVFDPTNPEFLCEKRTQSEDKNEEPINKIEDVLTNSPGGRTLNRFSISHASILKQVPDYHNHKYSHRSDITSRIHDGSNSKKITRFRC